MSRLSVAADRFRRRLIKREEEVGSLLVQRYGATYSILREQLDLLTRELIDLINAGEELTLNQVYRRTRLTVLLETVESEIEKFGQFAEEQVSAAQLSAIQLGREAAEALILTALGPVPEGLAIPVNFLRFNPANVERFLARASNGSPLRELFTTLAPNAREEIEQTFVNGIVQGLNPREIGRTLRDEFEIPLARANTISRTEVLNTYRDVNHQYYNDNDDIVTGWRWQCAFQVRTCAMCLAMDGKVFKVKTLFGTHPNCRCVLVPVTKSWEELGFKGIKDTRTFPKKHGREWFSEQPEDVQRRILGREKLKLYKEGKLTLDDVIGFRNDPAWGPNRWERSLKQIRAKKFVPKAEQRGILQERP